MNRKTRLTLAFILLAISIVSGTAAFYNYKIDTAAENQFQKIRDQVAISTARPVYEKDIYQPPQGLQDLMAANSSVIGWLKIEDTNIDYPIVQNKEDNEWFLHRDIDGNKSKPGSIYMDSMHDINAEGMHIIYGHHMKNGTMFKDISKYIDEEYRAEHQKITIWTDKREIRLEPLYCYTGKEDNTYHLNLDTREKLAAFLLEKTDMHISSDEIFVFITCSYKTRNGRCYLICRPTV
ncbi:class B sortase [Parablautia intestinalis]|uniref:Class B sortase n=1 Tax=Parablautia intestinalis TaxID=2320100 RepID=A0A3A9A6F2_9FIRM|nr:class B sortase [Parablautia intestinalis]RKI87232.1 class B sortase [Parablautia intestinalis]